MLRRADPLADPVRQGEEVAGDRDLGGVRGHRHRLLPQHVLDVLGHGHGDLVRDGGRGLGGQEAREVEAWRGRVEGPGYGGRGIHDREQARPVRPGRAAAAQRGHGGLVAAAVVGMAVAAVRAVGEDEVRVHRLDDGGDAGGDVVRVRRAERIRRHRRGGVGVPVLAPHHARVLEAAGGEPGRGLGSGLAQVRVLGDPQRLQRGRELLLAVRGQARPVALEAGQLLADDLTALAPGRGEEDDARTRAHQVGHRAARRDRFVVGMGVDEEDGGGRQRRISPASCAGTCGAPSGPG